MPLSKISLFAGLFLSALLHPIQAQVTGVHRELYLNLSRDGFSLDPPPPAGAVITGAGAFTWPTSVVGTNIITLRVTDNGVPPLDDHETISVVVLARPGFSSPILNESNFELTWSPRAGQTCAVEYKDDLGAPRLDRAAKQHRPGRHPLHHQRHHPCAVTILPHPHGGIKTPGALVAEEEFEFQTIKHSLEP